MDNQEREDAEVGFIPQPIPERHFWYHMSAVENFIRGLPEVWNVGRHERNSDDMESEMVGAYSVEE